MFQLRTGAQKASKHWRYRCLSRSWRRRWSQRYQYEPVRHFALVRHLHQEHTDLRDGDSNEPPPEIPIITYVPYEVPSRASSLRNGYSFPSTKDSLGLNSLGEPAEVLIIRERQRKREADRIANEDEPLQRNDHLIEGAKSSSDMLEEMNAERGIIDVDQVCKNIDAVKNEHIRPQVIAEGVIAADRYEDLASKLHSGFMVHQLAAYMKRNEHVHPVDPLDLHTEFSCALYARSSWSTENIGSRAPDIVSIEREEIQNRRNVQVKSEKQLLRKMSLVDEILRRYWQIRPEEDRYSSGEMDIRLQPAHLDLLVNHKRDILKQVSETYGAKVEAFTRDQIIRLTADFETCLDILKLVVHTLGNIRSSAVKFPAETSPDSLSSNPLKGKRKAVFRQIMESTNTVIKDNILPASDGQLIVYYLGPKDDDLEDARRLITQMSRTPSKGLAKVILGHSISSSDQIFVPIDVGNGLPMRDRFRQWSRWSSRSIRRILRESDQPVNSPPHLVTQENPLRKKETARGLRQFLTVPDSIHRPTLKMRAYWKSDITLFDSATFGQVIYPTPFLKSKRAGTPSFLKKIPREFVNLVPGLVNSLATMESRGSAPDNEFLLIRLTPSYKSSLPVPLEIVPDLEIRVFFDKDSKTTPFYEVRLVHRKELDILLPRNTMDLRFARQTCVYSQKDGLHPSIHQFINDSNLDIRGTSRLKTPAGLSLVIPLHSVGQIHDGSTTTGSVQEKHIQVEYEFASLDHRSEIQVPMHEPGSSAILTYTVIEAGKVGGRREELVLKQKQSIEPKKVISQVDSTKKISPNSEDATAVVIDTENPSASLLRKADALLNRIENPRNRVRVKLESTGVGSTQRDLNRAKAREEMRQELKRNRAGGKKLTTARLQLGPG